MRRASTSRDALMVPSASDRRLHLWPLVRPRHLRNQRRRRAQNACVCTPSMRPGRPPHSPSQRDAQNLTADCVILLYVDTPRFVSIRRRRATRLPAPTQVPTEAATRRYVLVRIMSQIAAVAAFGIGLAAATRTIEENNNFVTRSFTAVTQLA